MLFEMFQTASTESPVEADHFLSLIFYMFGGIIMKRIMTICVVLLAMGFISATTYAYGPYGPIDVVSGFITDTNGNPIAGATVQLCNSSGVSQSDGRYYVVTAPTNSILTISAPGYQTQSFWITTSNYVTQLLNIVLTPSN